ncbi:MAG: multicopper oxidase domain-containing protein, partial [Pseudooceanicola nanhaiensis]
MTPSGLARTLALATAALAPFAALAGTYDITVDPVRIETADFTKSGIGYNGSQIPTVLRFQEGEEVTIRVTNNLSEDTSIH